MMGAQRFWLSDFPDAKEVRLYLDEDPKAAAQEIADSKGATAQSSGVCFYVFVDGVLSVFVKGQLPR